MSLPTTSIFFASKQACFCGLTATVFALLSGCASAPSGGSGEASSGLLDKALQAVGLQKPAGLEQLDKLPPLPAKPSHVPVTLRLHAGEVLNTDAAGRPLTVVTRIYKLRATDTFLQSPYEAFQADDPTNTPFAKDVVEMRELVMAPGQRLESVEPLGAEVRALAVVTLFRKPAPGRWRFAFEAKPASASGVTLGLHGCAMSVAQGQPLNTAPELLRVAGVRCQ